LKIKNILPVAALLVSLSACNSDDTSKIIDSAEFQTRTVAHDKAYIPSLYYSNYSEATEQTVADAKAALAVYEPLWHDLQGYYRDIAKEASSSSYLQEVSGFLSEAGNFIEDAWKDLTADLREDVDLSAVHEYMEDIRISLKAWREDNEYSYLMDDMTAFHKSMEPLAGRLKTIASADQLTDAHVAALASDLSVLEPAWDKVKQVTPDILEAQFKFTQEKAQVVYNFIQAEGGNLTDLSLALASGNKDAALSAAQKIQPTFVKSFLSFGDFITPFVKDMAEMERNYIPALFYTNNPAVDAEVYGKVTTALDTFEDTWQSFKAHYTNNKTALNWDTHFTTIETALAEAKTYVAEQAETLNATGTVNLVEAHEKLERVRQTLMDLRTYENYDFVMDAVTRYHNAMEPIALAFKNGAEDFQALKAEVSNAQAIFTQLETALGDMDATAFGFDETQVSALQNAAQNQADNLTHLAAALDSGDNAAATAAGQQVKPLFIAFFKQLGAF
jgi:hypothetical protein